MTDLFKTNAPIVGDIKDGAYTVKLATDLFSKKGYEQELPGVYYSPNYKRYILRFRCVEGEYAGIVFSVYATEIDLSIMLADFTTQLNMTIATPMDIIKEITNKEVTLYRGVDEYIVEGTVGKARKWYANPTRFRTVQASPIEIEADEIL